MGIADKIPALSRSTSLRFAVLFIVLLAQGFPLGMFFFAIPIWLAASDAGPASIGVLISAATLPWTFKLFSGILMDRFTYLPMGKRRAWLIGAQSLIVIALLVGAFFNPQPSQIYMLSAIAFSVNTFCAFQDTAISGLAVDLVPENERARANGFILAGEAVGTAIGTILCGVLIARIGIASAFYGMALFVGLSMTLLLITRERPGERLLPWTDGETSEQARGQVAEGWQTLLKSIWRVMSKKESVLLATALGLYGVCYGLYAVIAPVIATQFGGWSDEDFATLNGVASLIAGLLGMLVFGLLIDRVGARLGRTMGMFLYALVGIVFVVSAPFWQAQIVFVIVVFLAFTSDVLMRIGAYATAMGFCDDKGAATQFALFLACANFGTIASGLIVGWLDALGGETLILFSASGAGFGASVLFLIIRDVSPQKDNSKALMEKPAE